MPQSGYGKIRHLENFLGAELPVGEAVAYGTTAGGCHSFVGPLKVTGNIDDTATGLTSVAKAGGVGRFSCTGTDAVGIAIGTEVIFSPVLNSPMAVEARLERAAVTAGVVFVGFVNANADSVLEPCTSTGTTITAVATNYAGFLLDSQLTATAEWHMPYIADGTAADTQTSTTVETDVNAVAGEMDILRVEVDPDGTVRWYLNGELEKTQASGLSTITLVSMLVGVWGTDGSTDATMDVDYVAIEANRDWTR